jgi:hypothetical protein
MEPLLSRPGGYRIEFEALHGPDFVIGTRSSLMLNFTDENIRFLDEHCTLDEHGDTEDTLLLTRDGVDPKGVARS